VVAHQGGYTAEIADEIEKRRWLVGPLQREAQDVRYISAFLGAEIGFNGSSYDREFEYSCPVFKALVPKHYGPLPTQDEHALRKIIQDV
jgi:hypothetical protein